MLLSLLSTTKPSPPLTQAIRVKRQSALYRVFWVHHPFQLLPLTGYVRMTCLFADV